jgi:hypothetical protein
MNDLSNEQQTNAEEKQSQSGQIIFKTSRLAIAAFVLGLFSFCLFIFTGIPAFILGIIALVAIEKSGGRLTGRSFAKAGIVIPFLSFFFLLILIPALARVKTFAYQMVCGMNLSQIGMAMLLYAPEYRDEFPRSGSNTSAWTGKIYNWKGINRKEAFDLKADGTGGRVSISSCFYLLVKYADVEPKMFVCSADGAKVWNPAKDDGTSSDITHYWDFGFIPRDNCSYSYHLPFGNPYYLTTSSEPGMAVAADRNPFIENASGFKKNFTLYNPTGTRDQIKNGNSTAHRSEGQNIMYLDAHVEFIKNPDCGIKQDCIYTCWSAAVNPTDIRKGIAPVDNSATVVPKSKTDSYLVNDGASAVGDPYFFFQM